jgi:hypothetical protein
MGLKEWFINIAIKKALGKVVTSAVASSAVLLPILANYGVKIELNEVLVATSLTALASGGYEFVRNFLKQKTGVKLP